MDYLHYNPVKHELVKRVGNWPYSSFHRHVAAGVYPDDWLIASAKDAMDFGEAV